MKVRDIMQMRVITVPLSATYEEAARLLSVYNISGVPVLDENGAVIGVVSEKDLFRIMYPSYRNFYTHPESFVDLEVREQEIVAWRNKPITDIMTTNIRNVHPDDPALKAGSIMLAHNVHRLPVIEEEKLVGIVSRRDIFKNIINTHIGSAEQ